MAIIPAYDYFKRMKDGNHAKKCTTSYSFQHLFHLTE